MLSHALHTDLFVLGNTSLFIVPSLLSDTVTKNLTY